MADLSPGLGAGHGGRPGVAEEVQHIYGPTRRAYLGHGPVPVAGLLREKPGVLEVHGLYIKSQLPVAYLPVLRQLALVPTAASGLAAAVAGVPVVPVGVAPGGVPYGLGVRAHQIETAPALQLFTLRAVDELKVLPFIRYPHIILRALSVHN